MDAFNIIAGIASIGSAIFAFVQARKALSSAKEAKQVEKNISHHRTTSDIAKLKEKADSLLSQISVYGFGGHPTKYQAADHDSNSERIQSFTMKVREFESCFTEKIKNEVTALVEDIDTELGKFNTPQITDENRKESGRIIMAKVNMVNSKFKSVLDKKVEKGT